VKITIKTTAEEFEEFREFQKCKEMYDEKLHNDTQAVYRRLNDGFERIKTDTKKLMSEFGLGKSFVTDADLVRVVESHINSMHKYIRGEMGIDYE